MEMHRISLLLALANRIDIQGSLTGFLLGGAADGAMNVFYSKELSWPTLVELTKLHERNSG